MQIKVEKVHQSPSTPVHELAYFIKIADYHIQDDPEIASMVKFLESKLLQQRNSPVSSDGRAVIAFYPLA